VLHHDHYNFHNVVTHDFFNQESGRVIYFQRTYTTSFSDAKDACDLTIPGESR
jgi:hypothetical protein